jgi:hypothetical protein
MPAPAARQLYSAFSGAMRAITEVARAHVGAAHLGGLVRLWYVALRIRFC